MIAFLEALAADIAEGIAQAVYEDPELCEPDRITVTAGEPPAPAGGCSAIWVWAARIEDANLDPEACAVRTVATFNYRIDVCYTETEDDLSDELHLGPAECLYGLMSAIWCHLVSLRDDSDLMGLGSCDNTTLLPLVVGQRSGGNVSATGGILFDYDCS